ncbi:hypothetical protein ACWFNS_05220 [Oerskovia enterophila]
MPPTLPRTGSGRRRTRSSWAGARRPQARRLDRLTEPALTQSSGSAPYDAQVSRTKAVVVACVTLVGLALTYEAGAILLAESDEGGIPPASAVPALPQGVTITTDGMGCGSGGCWRELTLSGPPGQSPTDLAASVAPAGQACTGRSWITARRVCSDVTVTGDEVRLNLYYDRPLGL